jgi:uncharacterized protein DUF5752
MKTADSPFQFSTVAYLTRIGNLHAASLRELGACLEKCTAESVFYHTYQSLGRRQFLSEGFSNDFAQWLLVSARLAKLAESIAAIDIRDFLQLEQLRRNFLRILADYSRANPADVDRPALEPFYFCESIEITVPLAKEAHDLDTFRACVEQVSSSSFEFHFLVSRLRLQLRTNDFSLWLAEQLGLESLAQRINRIDVYTNTLESARERMLAMVSRELRA